MTDKYLFTPEMDEISGFGGSYEAACRAMLKAALDWWDQNPTANPRFKQYSNIYGICEADNDDAKEMDKAMMAVADDCTGAMHQTCINHALWIRAHSWDEYVKIKTEQKKERGESHEVPEH